MRTSPSLKHAAAGRLGRAGLTLLARWAILGCLGASVLLGGPARGAAGPAPCQLREYASVPLVLGENHPPWVPVNINGHSTHLVLDLGGAVSTLWDGALPRLGLKTRPVPVGAPKATANGKPLTQYAVVPTLDLEHLQLKHVEILVQPAGPMPPQLALADATVGRFVPTTLNVDVELDLAHGKLNLFVPSACPGSYWSQQFAVVPMHQGPLGDWFFDMELDGKRLQAKFTTGGVQSYIYTNVAKEIYGWDAHSSKGEALAEPGAGISGHYRAMSLTTHGLSVMNAQIFLQEPTGCVKDAQILLDRDAAEGFSGCFGVAPLQLGVTVLKQLRLYMATQQQKLYFTAADAEPDRGLGLPNSRTSVAGWTAAVAQK